MKRTYVCKEEYTEREKTIKIYRHGERERERERERESECCSNRTIEHAKLIPR